MKAVRYGPVPGRDGKPVKAVILDSSGRRVLVGEEPHVYSDGAAKMLQAEPNGKNIVSVEDIVLRNYRGQDLTGKTLFMWRTGGFGDVLFLTPLIRHFKRRFPTCRIFFGTGVQHHMIFRGNPHVAGVLVMPFPQRLLDDADYHLMFEGTIEKSRDPKTHAVDVFARHAGVELDDKALVYQTDPARSQMLRRWAIDKGLRPDIPWVAVQMRATAPIRTYPEHLVVKLMDRLVHAGFGVLALGQAGDFPSRARQAGVLDVCGRFPDMADSVALMAACQVLVAPDSALVHFAGALGIPTVALYGPFPGAIRTAYYRNCVTLEGAAPCRPCMLHGHRPCPAAQKLNQKWSPCLGTLEPTRIVRTAKELTEQKNHVGRTG